MSKRLKLIANKDNGEMLVEVADAAVKTGLVKVGEIFYVNSIKFTVLQSKENNKIYLGFYSRFTVGPSALYIQDNLTAKMDGTAATGGCVLCNEYCLERIARAIADGDILAICPHCYADATANRYDDMAAYLTYNDKLLNSEQLPADVLPKFKKAKTNKNDNGLLRFSAFDDLHSGVQFANYCKIAIKNPDRFGACWTKNPWFIVSGLEIAGLEKKPENLKTIESCPTINAYDWKPSGICDRVFYVVTKRYADYHGIEINCCDHEQKRVCGECRRCYTLDDGGAPIYELLRESQAVIDEIDRLTVPAAA